MKNIESKTTKNGNTVYYMVDENGKKRQVSRKTAQEFIASNNRDENKMENTVAFMTANEANNSESADIAETDGSEEDTDDYTAELNETFNLLPAISELNDVDDTEPATVANTEPAKIDNTAATKTTKKAAKEQKWLADAKVDSDGKYQIVIDCDLDNRGDHKSWAPYTWVITNSGKRVRISYKFALELADSGRAIEVNKTESKKSKKAA